MAAHSRDGTELFFIVRGQGVLRLSQAEHQVRPGDVIVVSPGQEHAFINDGEQPLTMLTNCRGIKGLTVQHST